MPLDPIIAQGVTPIGANYADTQRQIQQYNMGMAAQQQENALRSLQIQQAGMGLQKQQVLMNAMGQGQDAYQNALKYYDPESWAKLQTGQKAAAEAQKAQMDQDLNVASAAASITSKAGHDGLSAILPAVAPSLTRLGINISPQQLQALPPDQLRSLADDLQQRIQAFRQSAWANSETGMGQQFVQGQENVRKGAEIAATDKRAAQERAVTLRGQDLAQARSGFLPNGQLDPKFDSAVEAILGYRAAPYQGNSARSGPAASIMAEVYRRDPTYDATAFPAKSKALNSLLAGKDGQTLDQVNTAVQHLSQLKGLLSALNTGDVQIINKARQAYQEATGNPAPTNAKVVANMAAGEVNKVVTGSPGAEEDRALARQSTMLTGSPEQQAGAIDNIIGLMAGRLSSTRNRAYQAKIGPQFERMLLPETLAALNAHGFNDNPGGGAPTPAGGAVNNDPLGIRKPK